MKNDIDVEGILRDILTVLNNYSVPVNTIALDISLLDQDFEKLFSQHELRNYKAGIFYKSLQVEGNIPATLQMKRRLPFNQIALRLERDILPVMQKWGEELEHDFTNEQVKVSSTHSDNHPELSQHYSYNISIECRGKEVVRPYYGGLILSVSLSQFDPTSYPTITAYVGRLVNEERDGDWGIQLIARLFTDNQEVHEGILQMLETSLPRLYKYLRTALTKPNGKQIA
jgi:hypothetical protein